MFIQLFADTDLKIHKNLVSRLGFDKNMLIEDIVIIAKQNDCNVIIKNGNGKWYLKSASLKQVEDACGNYPRRKCYFIHAPLQNVMRQDYIPLRIKCPCLE